MRAVKGWQWVEEPGDCTRYEVTFVGLCGGGYLVALWGGTYVAKVVPLDGWALLPVAGKWNAHLRQVVAAMLGRRLRILDGQVVLSQDGGA